MTVNSIGGAKRLRYSIRNQLWITISTIFIIAKNVLVGSFASSQGMNASWFLNL